MVIRDQINQFWKVLDLVDINSNLKGVKCILP